MEKAEEMARLNNLPMLILEVRKNNLPAITLYKKLGYRTISRVNNYYTDGETALVMIKTIKH